MGKTVFAAGSKKEHSRDFECGELSQRLRPRLGAHVPHVPCVVCAHLNGHDRRSFVVLTLLLTFGLTWPASATGVHVATPACSCESLCTLIMSFGCDLLVCSNVEGDPDWVVLYTSQLDVGVGLWMLKCSFRRQIPDGFAAPRKHASIQIQHTLYSIFWVIYAI